MDRAYFLAFYTHPRFLSNGLKFIGIVCAILILLASCSNHYEDDRAYSFVVAGHTYGSPSERDRELSGYFRQGLATLNKSENFSFGVLTGDIVKYSTIQEWDAVDQYFSRLEMDIYFAPGNHDISNRKLFESRYGAPYFYFEKEKDLFIILDSNIDGWSIKGKQLEFLKATLTAHSKEVENIFVFFHHLLWWDTDCSFSRVKPNSLANRHEPLNFWSEVEPLFGSLSNNVWMFAGDVGAFSNSISVAYHQYDNITFVASGMGGGINDNFVVVNVDPSNDVKFRLISLNHKSIDKLGRLEDNKFE